MDNPPLVSLDFALLPQYASYIIEHKLDEYVIEQIRLSREVQVPVLKYLDKMSENELFEVSKTSSIEFLDYFVRNKAADLITDSIKQWRSDQLPHNIGRYQLSADDLTLISYVRKQSLLKFLPQYSSDLTVIMQLIQEIDRYILRADTIAFDTYMKLMDEKLNDHLHFIEKIAATSPGIIYVYDLAAGKEIYTNGKARDILGITQQDLENTTWQDLQHPDDREAISENLSGLAKLQDGDVFVSEYRIRNNKNEYVWLRDHQSIFKRHEDGSPAHIIGLAMDIRAEKSMSEELIVREEQLLEAQILAEMGSFNWSLIDDESSATPHLRKILNIEAGTKFNSFMERVHPYDRRHVETALDEAIKTTGKYDAEFRYLGAGDERILWSRGVVSYKDGKAVSMKGTVMDVTERHHMVQRLKRGEELYKQAQALTHIGNWTWEIQRNKITWTDELYRIFGLEPQSVEITLDDVLTYIHPEDRELFIQNSVAVQTNSPTSEYYPRIILKDGTEKYINVKTEVIYDEKGVVFKLLGTAQDITQQKLSEKKLTENQKFIQKIADAAPSIIGVYNIHSGKYLFINQGLEKLLGYSPTQATEGGKGFIDSIIHPDDLASIAEQNNKALQAANSELSQGESNDLLVDFQYRMKHQDGEYRWFHTYGTIFDRNEKKQVEHVLNISIDITERIHAEKKVIEQQHFIQHIADASPTVLFLFDTTTNSVVYINKEITPVLGYTPEEVLGMKESVKSELFHPDDQVKVAQKSDSSKNEKAFKEYECKMKEKGKGWRCLLVREIGFMQNDAGDYTQVLCAALDISDRKNIEETLYHKTLELQQSNSSLEEFAYVASHDLKEPLRKITTFGDRLMFKEKELLKEDSLNYLRKIIESSQRMQRMIDDLLSISMISSEKTFENLELQSILDEVLQTLEFKIEENRAIIKSDKLPVASIIPSQFRQLFQNLLSNSLKFSRKDITPIITITHSYLSAAEIKHYQLNKSVKYLQLTFADNGIGFDEKHSEKIFSIFHRLHGRSEYEGTGIGLAICKKIVENHSGRITATGKENQGAIFNLVIPA